MHRTDILDQLRAYRESWPDEVDKVDRFIEFISSYDNCFDRELDVGHITGSAWVVNNAGTHVLLTHHKILNRWFQLGGHADGDSDVLRVAAREVEEESGLDSVVLVSEAIFDVDVHAISAHGNEPAHDHWDIRYAMRATGSEDYTVSEESHDLEWVEISNLISVTDEDSMHRMAKKWETLK